MNRKTKSLIGILVIVVVAAGIFFNSQTIKDNYIVRTTDLSSESLAIGRDIGLTDQANFIYKASQTEINDATSFNNACRSVAREQSIVLGCYTGQRIYVYDVTDQRLNGVKQVTAAHELLHAEYERMSGSERTEVNKLLESTAASIGDQRFKDTIAEYRRTEPDQIDNELHSIIGTEIEVIPAALEKHYQKYFTDRQKIVSYSKQYESTFTQLDDQIKQYDTQLDQLRSKKDQLEKTLNSQQSEIESEGQRLGTLKSSGSIAVYNAAVPGYNASIKVYNDNIAALKDTVNQYNVIVEKRNSLATTQNELSKQLDSNYQPIQ